MEKKIKVMSVFGTRPEAIKMAPLVIELEKNPNIESCLSIPHIHVKSEDIVSINIDKKQ